MGYEIRKMKPEEMSFAVDMAAQEGWNPGLHDGKCFYETDPEGFYIGLLDGKPIAAMAGIAYGGDFGFLGFYIVKEKYRGKGYGKKIWNEAVDRLGDRNIGADRVIRQIERYKDTDFKLAYKNMRFEMQNDRRNYNFHEKIVPLSIVSFQIVMEYDKQCFPADRSVFMKNWLKAPNTISYGYTENSSLCGIGTIRSCREGYKIGPLFADNFEIAEELFMTLINHAPDSKVFLDVPEVNKNAIKLAKKYKMNKVFETGRVYNKEKPKIAYDKIFGITSFELG